MKIGVLGTGMVGNAIASKLVALGHEVMMGSRTSDNAKARTWAKTAGPGVASEPSLKRLLSKSSSSTARRHRLPGGVASGRCSEPRRQNRR